MIPTSFIGLLPEGKVYKGMDAKKVYGRHKPSRDRINETATSSMDDKNPPSPPPDVSVRSRKVVHNMSQEGKLELLNMYNLSATDTGRNLFTAAQRCKDEDARCRSLLQRQNRGDPRIVGGDLYLGVLRDYKYSDVKGNRGTTPLKVLLFSIRSVQIYNDVAQSQTLVLHVDGSKSRVKWGATTRERDHIQCWQVWMSSAFIQKSHSNNDTSRFLRRNFSPKLLTEYHSAHTSTSDIAEFLSQFF